MKIVLSGVETNNKGAELMLYAILQEIERRFPDAKVYIALSSIKQGLQYIATSVDFRYWPLNKLLRKTHFNGILKRLHLPLIEGTELMNADYFLDGSGFLFSDQTSLWGTTPERWKRLLKPLYNRGTKIIFLPQAFGPLELEDTKKAIEVIGRFSSVIMPRERISYNFIKSCGLVDMHKVKLFTDFTSLVEGTFPKGYEHLQSGICIIPNVRMIDKGKISYDDYIQLLSAVIAEGKKSGHPVYLLNHEGQGDAELCLKCKETIGGDVEAVTSLNALDVKGLIASAYMVVTSRFHGLASALNSCVPSLATSWSHKYEELFHDYSLEGYVLPLDNIDAAIGSVQALLDKKENLRIREHLMIEVSKIKTQTREMWKYIWSL